MTSKESFVSGRLRYDKTFEGSRRTVILRVRDKPAGRRTHCISVKPGSEFHSTKDSLWAVSWAWRPSFCEVALVLCSVVCFFCWVSRSFGRQYRQWAKNGREYPY